MIVSGRLILRAREHGRLTEKPVTRKQVFVFNSSRVSLSDHPLTKGPWSLGAR